MIGEKNDDVMNRFLKVKVFQGYLFGKERYKTIWIEKVPLDAKPKDCREQACKLYLLQKMFNPDKTLKIIHYDAGKLKIPTDVTPHIMDIVNFLNL